MDALCGKKIQKNSIFLASVLSKASTLQRWLSIEQVARRRYAICATEVSFLSALGI